MSFMKKLFSSVGIGSAKVDTLLEDRPFYPGETIDALVVVEGGKSEQVIENIYFSLHTLYLTPSAESDHRMDRDFILDQFRLADRLTVAPGSRHEFPIEFVLPLETPLTFGNTRVWLQTGLDIRNAVDPSDRDYIHVEPTPIVKGIFLAMETLGFTLVEAQNEASEYFHGSPVPFVQEFEFKPTLGPFQNRLDEVELVFRPEGDRVTVFMEIDRRARGLQGYWQEMTETDESVINFPVYESDLKGLVHQLRDLLDEYC